MAYSYKNGQLIQLTEEGNFNSEQITYFPKTILENIFTSDNFEDTLGSFLNAYTITEVIDNEEKINYVLKLGPSALEQSSGNNLITLGKSIKTFDVKNTLVFGDNLTVLGNSSNVTLIGNNCIIANGQPENTDMPLPSDYSIVLGNDVSIGCDSQGNFGIGNRINIGEETSWCIALGGYDTELEDLSFIKDNVSHSIAIGYKQYINDEKNGQQFNTNPLIGQSSSYSIAVGCDVAIGENSNGSVVIGYNDCTKKELNSTSGNKGVSIGYLSDYAINIGYNSKIGEDCSRSLAIGSEVKIENKCTACVAIGNKAYVGLFNNEIPQEMENDFTDKRIDVGISIGEDAKVEASNGLSIGMQTCVLSAGGISIGTFATVGKGSYAGIAIGLFAKAKSWNSLSIGYKAEIPAGASNAIQLGQGTNNRANTFQVFGHQLLDANGKIPVERLPYYYGTSEVKDYFESLSNPKEGTIYFKLKNSQGGT